MKTWIILALAGAFIAGAFVSGLHYQAKISDLEKSAAESAAEYRQILLQKESEYVEKMAAAADAKQVEIDRLQSDIDGLRTETNRLRVASSRRSRVSKNAGNTCELCQQQVSKCIGLLSEGAELFEEGGGLLRGFNADREAIRKLRP